MLHILIPFSTPAVPQENMSLPSVRHCNSQHHKVCVAPLNVVSKNLILTAPHQTKMCVPPHMENLGSNVCCPLYNYTKCSKCGMMHMAI